MIPEFISIFKKELAVIGVFAILGLDASCNIKSEKQSVSNTDTGSVITEPVKEKDKLSSKKTDTLPQVKKSKIPAPVNPEEIFNLDLKEPITLSSQLINLKIDNSSHLLAQKKDMTRKTTILEVTVSYSSPPKNNYSVYVDTDKTAADKLAGFMNFYGAKEMMQIPGKYGSQIFLFDIKDEYDLKKLKDNLKLLIVNSSGTPANEIIVIKVRLETSDY